jgi:hypothetical protein
MSDFINAWILLNQSMLEQTPEKNIVFSTNHDNRSKFNMTNRSRFYQRKSDVSRKTYFGNYRDNGRAGNGGNAGQA